MKRFSRAKTFKAKHLIGIFDVLGTTEHENYLNVLCLKLGSLLNDHNKIYNLKRKQWNFYT